MESANILKLLLLQLTFNEGYMCDTLQTLIYTLIKMKNKKNGPPFSNMIPEDSNH